MTSFSEVLSSGWMQSLGWTLLHSLWEVAAVAETLLFFHPGVWWISRRIRIEREYCCDDAAVAVCGSNVDYAEALTALEESRAAPRLAVATTGTKQGGTPLDRVRRVLGLPSHDSCRWRSSLAGSLAVLVLVATLLGYMAVAGESDRRPAEKPETEHAGQGKDVAKPAVEAESPAHTAVLRPKTYALVG